MSFHYLSQLRSCWELGRQLPDGPAHLWACARNLDVESLQQRHAGTTTACEFMCSPSTWRTVWSKIEWNVNKQSRSLKDFETQLSSIPTSHGKVKHSGKQEGIIILRASPA